MKPPTRVHTSDEVTPSSRVRSLCLSEVASVPRHLTNSCGCALEVALVETVPDDKGAGSSSSPTRTTGSSSRRTRGCGTMKYSRGSTATQRSIGRCRDLDRRVRRRCRVPGCCPGCAERTSDLDDQETGTRHGGLGTARDRVRVVRIPSGDDVSGSAVRRCLQLRVRVRHSDPAGTCRPDDLLRRGLPRRSAAQCARDPKLRVHDHVPDDRDRPRTRSDSLRVTTSRAGATRHRRRRRRARP